LRCATIISEVIILSLAAVVVAVVVMMDLQSGQRASRLWDPFLV
jgi:hypothetical protein